MSVTRIVALFATFAGLSAGSLNAQTGQVPAEFPPASFTGMQYVDSAGCVFIRAGIDGNTTWVPRVNRQRRQVCGQTPSLSPTAIANAQPRQPAAEPVQITVDAPEVAAATPEPEPVAAPKPAAAPTRQVTRTRPVPVRSPVATTGGTAPSSLEPAVRSTPRSVTVAQRPQPQAAAQAATAGPACKGANRVSHRYINSGEVYPVRCGPQTASPTAGAVTRSAQAPVVLGGDTAQVTSRTRVLPRQTFDARLQERDVMQVPEGYRPVWTDDRLNPRRAEQSLGGIAQSRLVWTQTVPRRLVDQSTGRDVTAKVALVYPYTDVETQTRELGTVTLIRRDGQLLKRIKRNRTKARTPTAVSAPKALVARETAPSATVKPKATAKGRYVQVGTFGVPANAQKTAQRLVRAGVPARIGTLTRSGKSYRVVLAGPFTSRSGLNSGLQAARSMGFSDAFIR